MLSADGLIALVLTLRAYKKQFLTISLLIKNTKRKGYDPAGRLNSHQHPLSIKKTLKIAAMP
jgi:hypothetical protein